jgi:hypothetical protein
MKLALAYSTKDQVELTEQTFPILRDGQHALYWCDGSIERHGQLFFDAWKGITTGANGMVRGGADAAIAWKLSTVLSASQEFTYIGLIENDVLLGEDWLTPTMELFEKGKQDGLEVGAVSPRSYVDRILVQRDGYAVMHNIGAGAIIFTREAAKIVLRSFRTHWWADNVRMFAQISGVDLRTYACFAGREQFVTTDWGWEAQLARHGLASLALTPAKCQMIGQNPPLKEQGLALMTSDHVSDLQCRNKSVYDAAFSLYRDNLVKIRSGQYKIDVPGIIHRQNGGMLFFPHQLGYLAGGPTWQGNLELQNSQGFGPFAYRAGPDGASLTVRISGSCSFLVSGAGATVILTDTRSGYRAEPPLPADQIVELQVPGGPVPRNIEMKLGEGAIFYGIQTADPQMLDTTFRFDWSQLPKVA